MFIPGILISIVTFPGVIVHELAHQLFCRWMRVAVFEVVYFQFGDPVGYVLHEIPDKVYKNIFISTGPFLINTFLGFMIAMPAALHYKFDTAGTMDFFLLYLGVSIAMHAFPSTGDASSLWDAVMKNNDGPVFIKIVVAPIVGLIYLGALGSFFWLDLFYGIGVAIGLPWLIIQALS
jgi:hypothetical protein